MGQFSWITSDTDKSILVDGSVAVKMITPDGRVFKETNYEGYGVFGGQDYFALVAELNGKTTREEGIDLLYQGKNRSGDPDIAEEVYGMALPKLISMAGVENYDMHRHSQTCPEQGFRDWQDQEDTCYYCGEELDYCTCNDEEDDEYL